MIKNDHAFRQFQKLYNHHVQNFKHALRVRKKNKLRKITQAANS